MKQIFLFFLFSTSMLFALDLTKDEVAIHKEIDILQSYEGNIEDVINASEKFETIKFFRRRLIRQSNNNLWLKLKINHNNKSAVERTFITKWKRTNINLFLVKNKQIIHSEVLKKTTYNQYSSPMNLLPNEDYTLYLNIKINKALDELDYMYLLSSDKTIDFMQYKTKLYNDGVFFGILLTMTLYSFFMYFSIKKKSYLYLGFYQFSVLFYTSDLKDFLFFLFQDYPLFSQYFLKMYFSYFCIVLSILFTKEFLNTKEKMPKINTLLNASIIVLAITHMNLGTYEYGSIFFLVSLFVGFYAFFKGNKAAFFYVCGFSGFASFMLINNISKYLGLDIYFEYNSVLQVSTSIESFALTMALYLKLKYLMKEKQDTEKMLQVQSKFASMGEMLASIAHQWRQPLNHLSSININLQLASEMGKLDKKYLNKKILESNNQILYMSDTVKDFTTFFSTNNSKESFILQEVLSEALTLVKSRISNFSIKVNIKSNVDNVFVHYKNEIIQILVIILNNAIDALKTNNIKNRKIDIIIDKNTITINDNAGGINEDILSKIFDPYFSTKDKKSGSGLGLYTAKIIVQNIIKGTLTAKNIEDGTSFILLLSSEQK